MASTTAKVPRFHKFDLIDGMQLQINVSGWANSRNVRVEFQLKNCSRTWILHWGFTYRGNRNWYVPSDQSTGLVKQGALQTPFVKRGELFVVVIELRDPKIHAIEFVLKDGSGDKWLKLNRGNFCIEIPEIDESSISPNIPKDLIVRKAYQLWEKRGKPISSPEQQKKDYEDAIKELQNQLSKEISLNEPQSSHPHSRGTLMASSTEQTGTRMPYYCHRRHNIEQWIQKGSSAHANRSGLVQSALANLVEKSLGGDNVVSRQCYRVGSCEIVVFTKISKGDCHVIVAVNIKGATVLHWGISKLSANEWVVPPPDILPKKSKLVTGACQTHFTEMSTGKGYFQSVDINLQHHDFAGIQFVIWSGGTWIKNNGANFFVGLKLVNGCPDGERIVKWLLDEISSREKGAERSLMHRYNIATELTERCKNEGELGLCGIMVWLRFMACRQLACNKNYNVKPREISEAQDRFTNLLQRIYLSQPNCREIVKLILSCVGRGGRGDVGQRIRDEILVLQRNNDCKGGMIEEWHQKLHNNSSPDDVIICEALINYVKSDFRIDVYWSSLNSKGITKQKLASYERPILSEPRFRKDIKEGLIRDLTAYLKTLKAVHSGVELESAIEICLVSMSKGHDSITSYGQRVGFMPPKLLDCLRFIKEHICDNNISLLMEKLLESRIELRPLLLTSHERLKDLLFLDLALASTVRTTIERGLQDLKLSHPPIIMFFISLALENLCLSTVNNEDLIYCTKDWYRICDSYKSNDVQWAMQTKAILDRLQLILADRSQHFYNMIQPSARYLGKLLAVEKWTIDIFTEELMRGGTAAMLSTLINLFDPVLRKLANLGCWQIISPVDVSGYVSATNRLSTIQTKKYTKPTIIIADRVTGEEEIPQGVVAVLTPDMPDVLSHIAIRARNSKVCFATCFNQNILKELKMKEGKAISIQVKLNDLIISDVIGHSLSRVPFSISIPRRPTLEKISFSGKYAISMDEFTNYLVGAKSCNLQFLRGRLPSWIKIPLSVSLPFGVFEMVLSEDLNKDISCKISYLKKLVHGGDLSKLEAIQETVLQMKASFHLITNLKIKMKSSRMPWPGDEGEERWDCAWHAIKKVWASKWNQRAVISCKKENLNHDNLTMAVLIQEVICADYAFVIHTKNPLSGDTSEMYTEIVKGLGETLVGAYPGRALNFITKKANTKSSVITGYPSKHIGLFSKKSIIFRSDSNCEDLVGYAGAGLYDSVVMDKEEKVVLDYSRDRLMIDKAFQMSIFTKIAEVGKIIEGLYGRPQDIEGVIKDGGIYVVQSRPQI